MATLDKTALLARSSQGAAGLDTEDVELRGGTITVRAVTRDEIRAAKRASKGDDGEAENHLIATAMVAPELTVDEVAQWLNGAPAGESVLVSDAIQRLSGLAEGAQKSGVPEVRARRRR